MIELPSSAANSHEGVLHGRVYKTALVQPGIMKKKIIKRTSFFIIPAVTYYL